MCFLSDAPESSFVGFGNITLSPFLGVFVYFVQCDSTLASIALPMFFAIKSSLWCNTFEMESLCGVSGTVPPMPQASTAE